VLAPQAGGDRSRSAAGDGQIDVMRGGMRTTMLAREPYADALPPDFRPAVAWQ